LTLGGIYGLQYKLRLHAAGIRYALLHASRPAVSAPVMPPRRLALLMAGLIGDTVMCTPVVSESRRIWPEARITLIGMQHNCDLLSGSADIDGFRAVTSDPFTIRRGSELCSFRDWLAKQNFDIAIVLLGDQFALELAKAGIPTRVGVAGHPLSRSLTHVYDNGTPQTWGPEEKLNSLRVLGCPARNIQPAIRIHDTAWLTAAATLQQLGVFPGDAYCVVHPFGRTAPQRWPTESCNRLASLLSERYRLKVILAGNAEAPFLGSPGNRLIDARGKFNLKELPAVLDRAAFVISTDSGPFHIAGALERPLVGLFRSVRLEHSRRYPQAQVLAGTDDDCRGRCAWNRCRRLPCRQMSAITIPEVLTAVGRIHQQHNQRR
jgi:ADP-heptose:LPS heptosyltransferase